MVFRQFVDDDLGCASYLVGDDRSGEAVVLDPAYAIEPYLLEAERQGVRIVRVLETHTHADHVSGHGRLALEHGIPVAIHPEAQPEFPFEPVRDGERIVLGDVVVDVVHTPGHRPEHCCFVVTDRVRGEEPWLAITGDSLFVGDAARPDLAVGALEGAQGLFRSLRRLLELPDGVEVYPGHVAGSLCGAGMSSKPSSTIGFERRSNRALILAAGSEEDFVEHSARVSASRPPTVERVVALNRGPFVGRPKPLEELADPSGATILDVRPAREFAAGHVAGAINVPLTADGFGTRAGFVLSPDERIAIQARSRAEAAEAAKRLNAVGFLELAGYVVDPAPSATLEPVSIRDLEALLADEAVELVDVRERTERDAGYIPGSRHVPYRLVRACAADLADGVPVVTICETGARAAVAASLFAAAGVEARPVLDGGVPDWQARGNRPVAFRRCGT